VVEEEEALGGGRGGAVLVAWALDIAWPSLWLADCPPKCTVVPSMMVIILIHLFIRGRKINNDHDELSQY